MDETFPRANVLCGEALAPFNLGSKLTTYHLLAIPEELEKILLEKNILANKKPTAENKKLWNCKLLNVDVNGCPSVLNCKFLSIHQETI